MPEIASVLVAALSTMREVCCLRSALAQSLWHCFSFSVSGSAHAKQCTYHKIRIQTCASAGHCGSACTCSAYEYGLWLQFTCLAALNTSHATASTVKRACNSIPCTSMKLSYCSQQLIHFVVARRNSCSVVPYTGANRAVVFHAALLAACAQVHQYHVTQQARWTRLSTTLGSA